MQPAAHAEAAFLSIGGTIKNRAQLFGERLCDRGRQDKRANTFIRYGHIAGIRISRGILRQVQYRFCLLIVKCDAKAICVNNHYVILTFP